MNNNKVNIILDIITVVIILVLISLSIISWIRLPEQIPNHFDSMGNIKDYMTKNFIFFPVVLASVLGVCLLILSRYPKIYNYSVEITDKNREIQYYIATKNIRILNIEMLLMFSYMQYCIVTSNDKLSYIFIFIVIILFSVGIGIYKSNKYK